MSRPALISTAILLLIALGCVEPVPLNQSSVVAITPADVQYHINYLASDELEGRLSGTPGCETAAKYIAAEFKRFGLEPIGDDGSYFQEFDFVGDVELGAENHLQLTRGGSDTSWSLEVDFIPAGFSSSASLEAEVAFAGYGIAAVDQDYDDYEGLDVNGKAVLVLRYSPMSNDPHAGLAQFAPLRYKAMQARRHGAAALLIATSSVDDEEDRLPKLRFDPIGGDAGLPVVFVKRALADWLLAGLNLSIDSLQQQISSTTKPNSFLIPDTELRLATEVRPIRRVAANVIGILRGSDPVLQNQAVVIGAHYDHLGRSSEKAQDAELGNVIHNGADDNASGTAGVLELAQYFSGQSTPLKRSVLFMAFAGEELGVLGSSYYVDQPRFPLENTTTMINMDMIGRMKDSSLVVEGVGTSPAFAALLQRLSSDQRFHLKPKAEGLGPSDHSSFYKKDIPVLFFFTGLHDDYHRATDDADKINARAEAEIVKLVSNFVLEIANSDSVPLFTKAEPDQRRQVRGFRVSLGTIPDYAAEVEGVKLSGVRQGGAADQAGLRAGDIIVKFGDIEIKNIYDYTYALSEFSPGQEVEVQILRDSVRQTLNVKLQRARRR